VAGYTLRWFTWPQMVTHYTNRARCRVTTNYIDQDQCITTKPHKVFNAQKYAPNKKLGNSVQKL